MSDRERTAGAAGREPGPGPLHAPAPIQVPREAVLLERNRLLYDALPASVAATIMVAGFLAIMQTRVIDQNWAAGWFVVISVLNLGRLLVARDYENRSEDLESAAFFDKEFALGGVAGGLGWGAAGVLLFPPDVLHQAFLGFVVAGVAAGSIGSLSPSFRALLGFLLLSLGPLAARLLATGDPVATAMGVLAVLFLAFLLVSGRRVGRLINESIRLRLMDAGREAEARRAKELLERVGRIARIGGWEWDRRTDTARWSEQVYRMYDRDPGEPVGVEEALDGYPEPDRSRLAEAVDHALEDREPYDLELRFEGAGPDVRWVRTQGQPVIHADEVIGLTGTVQDITERKETARQLRTNLEALERLQAIAARADTTLDQKIDGILGLGLDALDAELAVVGRVRDGEYIVEHVAGVGEHPGPGSRFDLGETYSSHVWEADDLVTFDHAGRVIGDHRCYRKFELESYIGTPLRIAGEPYGTVGFSSSEPRTQPFSEPDHALIQIFAEWIGHELGRTQALAGLAESEERTRLILQSVGEGIFGLDLHGRATFVNPTALDLLGYTADEILGGDMHGLVHHSHADGSEYPSEDCPTMRTLVDGQAVTVKDDVLWTKAGDPMPVEFTSTPVRKGGALMGAVVSFRDITERKEIERLKNEFVSTVSHELRTPLTSIRGSLGLVAGGATGELPERAAELVRIAARNSERLILLINDILDMEKIESGKLDFTFRPQPIMPLIEQAVEANAAFAEGHDAELVVTRTVDEDVRVNVDENRVAQVMTNLISNAAKFTDPGTDVELAVWREPRTVRVAVTDHGPGIPEEFRSRIFEKFSQADASDQREKGGTGLGLNITRALVERMGGRTWFETETGVGTTFTFELPVWLPGAREDRAPRVLICEADGETGERMADVLRDADYHVEVVTDADAARDRLAREGAATDALILDLGLPEGGAVELVRWLRSSPGTAGLPVVAMAANIQDGRLELGVELQLVDWLPKPVKPEDLEAVLVQLRGAGHLPEVLHVEDDEDLRHTVREVARDLATFHAAGSLEAARTALNERSFDLVLLDLGLPDGSGWDLMPTLNELEDRPAVVIFSAHTVHGPEAHQVEAALLKSRTTEGELLNTMRRLLPQESEP